jgi:ArsR family transcriptional regulator, arsenate/arsenite/antimonite-responsive transcriptional repressor / arsenate reductase (thioredoxin)
MTTQSRAATMEATTNAAVAALRFLGDATRLRVVRELAAGPVYGTDLAVRLGLPQNLAAYHLRQLEAAGLLRRERREHRVYYALDPEAWAAFTAPVRQVCNVLSTVTEAADDAAG